MRKLLLASAVVMCAILFSGSARAETSTIDVKIPFPFMVHNTVLPAGEYVVEQAGSDVLLIAGEHGTKGAAYVLASPETDTQPAGDKPVLTFTKYENEWRLARVEQAGTGREMLIAQ